MQPKPQEKKPWPMWWVVLAVALFIPIYTWLTLHYRKPGRAFMPYQDMRERADVIRLLKAGYRRVGIDAVRPAEDALPAHDIGAPAPGGLPQELGSSLVEKPLLPLTVSSVSASAEAVAGIDYSVRFAYTVADNKRQLSGAHLYERPGEVVIVADFERLDGSLLARYREGTAVLTIPPGALRAGRYRVTLVGEQASRAWTITVR